MYVQAISKKPVLLHRNELSHALDSWKYERNERFEMENGVECGAIGSADAPRATRRRTRIELNASLWNLGETCTAYEREDRAENRRKSVFGPRQLIDGSGRQSFRGHREVIERPVPAYRRQNAWILALSVTPCQAANDINKRARHRRTSERRWNHARFTCVQCWLNGNW